LTVPVFVVCYVVGAAALAIWIDLRFPGLRPSGWLRLGLAIGAAMAADELCGRFLHTDPRIIGITTDQIGKLMPLLRGALSRRVQNRAGPSGFVSSLI